MTIDTKRLATDAAYWDSVAPEGATHYNPNDTGSRWWRIEKGLIHESVSGKWSERLFYPKNLIPRPQAPEAEWDGSDRPPIGIWVEHNKHGDYATTRIIGYDGSLPICSHGEGKYYGVPMSCMRPIPTKAQRDRDELAELIEAHQMRQGSFCTPKNMADAIIAAGWRKEQ